MLLTHNRRFRLSLALLLGFLLPNLAQAWPKPKLPRSLRTWACVIALSAVPFKHNIDTQLARQELQSQKRDFGEQAWSYRPFVLATATADEIRARGPAVLARFADGKVITATAVVDEPRLDRLYLGLNYYYQRVPEFRKEADRLGIPMDSAGRFVRYYGRSIKPLLDPFGHLQSREVAHRSQMAQLVSFALEKEVEYARQKGLLGGDQPPKNNELEDKFEYRIFREDLRQRYEAGEWSVKPVEPGHTRELALSLHVFELVAKRPDAPNLFLEAARKRQITPFSVDEYKAALSEPYVFNEKRESILYGLRKHVEDFADAHPDYNGAQLEAAYLKEFFGLDQSGRELAPALREP